MLQPRYQTQVVSTILTPDERLRVDAAGAGHYVACHRNDIGQIIRDVRVAGANAILLSITRCENAEENMVNELGRELPHVLKIGILSEVTEQTPRTLLELGRCGVRSVVDVRLSTGWIELRRCLSDEFDDVAGSTIVGALVDEVPRLNSGCRAFFEKLVRLSRTKGSVRAVCDEFQMLPSTIMSRFFRAGLPAPKKYLAETRLIRAAYLFQNPGFSIANVANHLEYSSPQSFGRHVMTMRNTSAGEFRLRYSSDRLLSLFRAELIRPYVKVLQEFDPLTPGSMRGRNWPRRREWRRVAERG